MSRLLEPLNDDQRAFVDLVSEAFLSDGHTWPIFDYVEAQFDRRRKDAWETLYSLPRSGRWQYGAAWWVGLNQPQLKPPPENRVELTVVGMHHSKFLDSSVSAFFGTFPAHPRSSAPRLAWP